MKKLAMRKLIVHKKDIPNLLTVGRVVVIPLFVAAFYLPAPVNHCVAASLFALAAITDFFDGFFARKWQVTSRLGQMLDPIADKLLVAAALLMLAAQGVAPIIPALVILLRELFVSGLREYMAKFNVTVQVTRLAKLKTTVQMVAIFILLLNPGVSSIFAGALLLWAAAALTAFTGWQYFRACWPELRK